MPAQHRLFADLYTFSWSKLDFRLPLISAAAVALCLFTGVAIGHPGAALIAGGGALTIGFGANQRIHDSRVLPMLLGVIGVSTATLAGTIVGHRGYELLLASIVASAIYGILTVRNAGIAWVGQQACVALFVASAFPSPPKAALERAGLMFAGGLIQTVITTLGLSLMPELRKQLAELRRSVLRPVLHPVVESDSVIASVRSLPEVLPHQHRRTAIIYAIRLMLTVAVSTEFYRRLGIQSGYWTPMTALLVQKPGFSETLTRALLRTGGTLAGAVLATILITHVPLSQQTAYWVLAGVTSLFAFASYATNPVNYGLFTLSLTAYIVFLLSLNQIPGPEIAYRRALCTIAGAAIALVIHVDALRQHGRLRAAKPDKSH